MRVLDVNVVIAAHGQSHAHHDLVRPWFDRMLTEDAAFSIPQIVWVGFIRIVTSRRAMAAPTPLEDAFAFLHAVTGQPGHVELGPEARHLAIFERLCTEYDATGDLVPDAYLAALAIEHGCTLVSLDRDFARFEDLRWERPG